MELTQQQSAVLQRLGTAGRQSVPRLVADLQLDQSQITAAGVALEAAGLISVQEDTFDEFRLGPEGEPYVSNPLPERVIARALAAAGGEAAVTDLPGRTGLNAGVIGQTLRWLQQRNWAVKQGDRLVLQPAAANGEAPPQADEQMLAALAGGRVATAAELSAAGVDVPAAVGLLGKRKGFLIAKPRMLRTFALTPAGEAALKAGVKARRRVTQLTPEMMLDGSWRDADFAPYDVTLAAKRLYPGKEHPFQRTLDRVRRVFLEMGFTEIVSPWVESSFWDFDALYQPQDHPARDMQDTFYVAQPGECRLPDAALVKRIQATHENGGDTGSSGWQYRWREGLAKKPVLRTHTTAATIRALARHAKEMRNADGSLRPGKYFVIGPVFRRETVDFKHLPIFHQVDGIIVDPKASLVTLKGTLQAFYQKMGFPKVQFAPSFFPYTEPSAEVFAFLESRGEFVEMGGSGIFRPEVTRPLGIADRVIAWGLGLERLAMLLHGLPAIGDIYFASMPWLRESPLSRS
jgi:phenylalanyl-tRNA synthetase alpha chain